jgi:hypothetical protein
VGDDAGREGGKEGASDVLQAAHVANQNGMEAEYGKEALAPSLAPTCAPISAMGIRSVFRSSSATWLHRTSTLMAFGGAASAPEPPEGLGPECQGWWGTMGRGGVRKGRGRGAGVG